MINPAKLAENKYNDVLPDGGSSFIQQILVLIYRKNWVFFLQEKRRFPL